jgi:hypothetical protein
MRMRKRNLSQEEDFCNTGKHWTAHSLCYPSLPQKKPTTTATAESLSGICWKSRVIDFFFFNIDSRKFSPLGYLLPIFMV